MPTMHALSDKVILANNSYQWKIHIHTYIHALTPFEIFTLTQFLYEERRKEF